MTNRARLEKYLARLIDRLDKIDEGEAHETFTSLDTIEGVLIEIASVKKRLETIDG